MTTSVKWEFFDAATVTLSVTNYNKECDRVVVAAAGNQVDEKSLTTDGLTRIFRRAEQRKSLGRKIGAERFRTGNADFTEDN